jgi:regulatory protein
VETPDPGGHDRSLENAALRLLKVRERSRKELATKLLQRGHCAQAVDALLEDLVADRWIDDERFARVYVRDRLRLNPRSYRRLDLELARRGIDGPVRSRVLAEARRDAPEEEVARRMAAARWRRLSGNAQARREALVRWLKGRGFSRDVTSWAAARAAGEIGEGDLPIEDS